jgi:hypothetical protein
MTTENRAIRVRGVVEDIPVGGIGIQAHHTTSCGCAAVAQETGQTNIHFLQFTRGNGILQSISYRPDASKVAKVRANGAIFWKKANNADRSGCLSVLRSVRPLDRPTMGWP